MDITATIAALSTFLEHTALSARLQETAWVVPAVQTVHILSVATVFASSAFVSLHLLGVSGRELSAGNVALRFVPFIWWTLPLLLLSGSVLIVAEPARSLPNPAFHLKLGLLLAAVLVTLLYQWPLSRRADFWEATRGRVVATKLIAVTTLALWTGVIVAGRFIAYVDNL